MLLITIIHIIIAIMLIIFVLLQDSKGGAAGMFGGGGGSSTLFGASGGADFLTKMTRYTAVAFALTSLLLVWQTSSKKGSVLDGMSSPPPIIETQGKDSGDMSKGETESSPAEKPADKQ